MSRDIESFTHQPGNTPPVAVNSGSNGTPDVEDLFAIVGLFGGDTGINGMVRAQIQARLLIELAQLYPSVNVSFTFSPPGTFPGTASVAYSSFGFSQICIAGAESPSGTSGVLGAALFDPRNDTQNDNCLTDFGGSQRLGVFVHTLINSSIGPPSVSTFRQTYDPFTPLFGGTPIGDAGDGLDGQRVLGLVMDSRQAAILLAITRMGRSIAVVTAHECGHSVGLVQDGAMPNGLYGGDNAHFPGSTGGHIFNVEFVVGGSVNVMSPAIGFDGTLSPGTAFNTLNLAYLREQAIYN
jgi:hypothetical protein